MYGFQSINVHETRYWVTTFLNNLPILTEIQTAVQWPILGHNEMKRRTVSTLSVVLLRTERFIMNYCYIQNQALTVKCRII